MKWNREYWFHPSRLDTIKALKEIENVSVKNIRSVSRDKIWVEFTLEYPTSSDLDIIYLKFTRTFHNLGWGKVDV